MENVLDELHRVRAEKNGFEREHNCSGQTQCDVACAEWLSGEDRMENYLISPSLCTHRPSWGNPTFQAFAALLASNINMLSRATEVVSRYEYEHHDLNCRCDASSA